MSIITAIAAEMPNSGSNLQRPRGAIFRALGSLICAVIRIALGMMFIYSGLSKITEPYQFLSAVYAYDLLGPKSGEAVAIVLPWLEFLTGVCLLANTFTVSAFAIAGALGVTFTIVVYSAIARELNIACGCFGSDSHVINYSTLVKSGAIVLVAGTGLLLQGRSVKRG